MNQFFKYKMIYIYILTELLKKKKKKIIIKNIIY